MDTPHEPHQGRRGLNKLAKRERIQAAAAKLFDTHGYSTVTTQLIAEHADVAAGTVFRYAATKAELLVMVYNELLRGAIARGIAEGAKHRAPDEAVLSMVTPLLTHITQHRENSAVYQRELLFGDRSAPFRHEGLTLITELEGAIAARMRELAPHLDPEVARIASASVFALAHMATARLTAAGHHADAVMADVRTQITQVVCGALAAREILTKEMREEQ